jgi:hypothetical protein
MSQGTVCFLEWGDTESLGTRSVTAPLYKPRTVKEQMERLAESENADKTKALSATLSNHKSPITSPGIERG